MQLTLPRDIVHQTEESIRQNFKNVFISVEPTMSAVSECIVQTSEQCMNAQQKVSNANGYTYTHTIHCSVKCRRKRCEIDREKESVREKNRPNQSENNVRVRFAVTRNNKTNSHLQHLACCCCYFVFLFCTKS